ncbi:unnamed protein product [Darwinula stevensoni]|uniref:nicotinate phosphoribosyltransferase n=1 Tax=Darwinula stevensoni TaxID=69355 RepID=A0A7R9FNJ0_9CRUS|nr:unnamed protein product [Darwinula stevensoni]CAG0896863.1 unnamed protein product [Darwinula stevensoni]
MTNVLSFASTDERRNPDSPVRDKEDDIKVTKRAKRQIPMDLSINETGHGLLVDFPMTQDRWESFLKEVSPFQEVNGRIKRQYPCKECGKSFSRNLYLREHSRVHTGENLYSCKECGQKFAHSNSLVAHRKSHVTKTHCCKTCEECFATAAELRRHTVVHKRHLAPYRFVCKICDQRFTQAQHLNRHELIHLEEYMYEYRVQENALIQQKVEGGGKGLGKALVGRLDRSVSPPEAHRADGSQDLILPGLARVRQRVDLYQITMAYAYWKSEKVGDMAVFDLFFRKNPFQGEFTIFAGLDECLKFLENFRYSDSDILYLRSTLPSSVEPDFFDFLKKLTTKDVTLYAIEEGSVVFPRVPLLRLEGPLIVVQLLETTLLTLVNYASLVATNAARYRMAAGKHMKLLEFGLRRAQGPDGGLSASKYTYIGGFDGTSNVLAGKLFGIPVSGTHAHAYISSYLHYDELKIRSSDSQKETGDRKEEEEGRSSSTPYNLRALTRLSYKETGRQIGHRRRQAYINNSSRSRGSSPGGRGDMAGKEHTAGDREEEEEGRSSSTPYNLRALTRLSYKETGRQIGHRRSRRRRCSLPSAYSYCRRRHLRRQVLRPPCTVHSSYRAADLRLQASQRRQAGKRQGSSQGRAKGNSASAAQK